MRYFVCFTAVVFSSIATQALASDEKTLSAPPPGFEFLLEPQSTQVDIFYGGRYVGAVMATYAPGEIEFQNPAAVAALIPNLLDRKRIRQNLTGILSSNAYLVCRNQYSEDCGTVEPAISAVVFDESRFRVDVFVAETELSVQEVAVDKYLPPAETGFSFIHALSAVYSSLERSDDNYSINGNTLLSHKESRIRMFSNISKDDDLNIDVLAYERDFEGRSYQVGLLQTNNQNAVFLPTLQITGARFASSLDTRNDLDFSEGSPLNVFLASRSRVEIFKDDRLVTSGIYEAGNQSLDTRALPGGAYDITIKVVRAGAVLREEQRFYRKSSQIPPEDQDLFFIEGGRLMENFNEGTFPESADNFLFRGGYSSRVSDGFGLNGSVAVAQTDKMLEVGGFYLGEYIEVDFTLANTQFFDQGYFVNMNTRVQELALSANFRKIDIFEDERDFIEDLYLLGPISSEQYSVRASYPIGSGRISLESRVNDNELNTIRSQIATVSFPQYTFADRSYFSSNFEISRENDLWQAFLRLSLNFSTQRWQYRLSHIEQRFEDEQERTQDTRNSSANVTWRDDDLLVSDIDANLNLQRNEFSEQADASVQWETYRGRASLSADRTSFDGGQSASYSAALSTTFVGDKDGVVVGGSDINQAAVLVELDSPDIEGSYFDVLVDNAKRSYAKAGNTTIVNLRPFETYSIQLKDNGAELVSMNAREETVTLYPGNVKRFVYKVEKIDVVFGRIVSADGKAIKNALIEGVAGIAITDDYGFFQAELNSSTTSLRVRNNEMECTVQVPEYSVKKQVARLGKLTCL